MTFWAAAGCPFLPSMAMLFAGSIRFSTADLRSNEYPKSSSYSAHLKNRGKEEGRTTTLTQGA